MALAGHVMHAAAGLGLDEATRPEHVGFGEKNLSGENIRPNQRGDASKRFGFSVFTQTNYASVGPTASYRMFADRDSVVRMSDGSAHVLATNAAAWRSLGRVPEAACRLIDVPSMGTTTYFEDMDRTNGYLALSWLSLVGGVGAAYLSIVQESTGAVVRIPEKIGTSDALAPPLLAVVGNYFVVVRINSALTDIEAWSLDTTSKTTIETGWVAFAAPLCTDATGGYTVHSLPATGRFALLYGNSSGGASRLTVLYSDDISVLATQTIDTASVTPDAFALGGLSTDTCWLAWNEATLIRARGQDPTTVTSTLATKATIMTMATGCDTLYIAGSTTAGQARIVANDTNATMRMQMRGVQTSVGAAATLGSQITVPAVKAIRRPFQYGGRFYGAFYGADDNNTQNNFILCDFTDDETYLRPVANPAPGLASAGLTGQGKFVANTAGTKYFVGMGVKRSGVADGTAIAEFDFAATTRWQSETFGNSTYLSGGLAACYDGLRVAELGFLLRPPTPTGTVAGTGITGTFKYVAVYEEVDGDGNWHVSGLSSPSANVVPANQTVTVTTAPLTITARMGAAAAARSTRIAWYRTLTGGAAPYYRLGTTINDTSAVTATFSDAVTDATLAAESKLYSQPGIVGTAQDRRPPPPFSCIAAYNGMLVGASGSDVWYSGQNVQGEGVWFNPIFQVPVEGPGDITALFVQDGTLFVCKRRAIFAITGEPPSDNGAAGGLGMPRRLAVDLGCLDQRSCCVTALGTFLQSERGIEIFTRAQSLEWIGEAMQATVTAFPIVTSATVDPASSTVLIELAATETANQVATGGGGRTLVFDLTLKDWVSVDRRWDESATPDMPSQSACVIYTGSAYRYAWLSTTGRVFYENRASYLDANGLWVTSKYETAWLKHGLQQEQRVWAGAILFQRNTAAGLKIEVAYDYAAYSAANDKVWTEAETLSGLRQLPYAPKSRGIAMKFRVSDTAPVTAGTGQGFTFIGMSFDLAAKQGATKGTGRLDPALRK